MLIFDKEKERKEELKRNLKVMHAFLELKWRALVDNGEDANNVEREIIYIKGRLHELGVY